MIEPFIIEYIKRKQREKEESSKGGIPLYIDPPYADGYKDRPNKDEIPGNKGYIEIDIVGDSDEEVLKI